MLTINEKSFFIHTAIGASTLSGCYRKRGALLIRGRQILSHGYNRDIIKNDTWEVSAIYDAIFGARSEPLEGTALFCTYFPSVHDIMLIVSVGVQSIYFMGEIIDSEAVRLINKLKESSIPLEIIELEKNNNI